jgi:hypothetical protein
MAAGLAGSLWSELHDGRPFRLDRRVIDAELLMKARVQVRKDAVRRREVVDHDVTAHRILAGRQRPHMQIVDRLHPGNISHRLLHVG